MRQGGREVHQSSSKFPEHKADGRDESCGFRFHSSVWLRVHFSVRTEFRVALLVKYTLRSNLSFSWYPRCSRSNRARLAARNPSISFGCRPRRNRKSRANCNRSFATGRASAAAAKRTRACQVHQFAGRGRRRFSRLRARQPRKGGPIQNQVANGVLDPALNPRPHLAVFRPNPSVESGGILGAVEGSHGFLGLRKTQEAHLQWGRNRTSNPCSCQAKSFSTHFPLAHSYYRPRASASSQLPLDP